MRDSPESLASSASVQVTLVLVSPTSVLTSPPFSLNSRTVVVCPASGVIEPSVCSAREAV